jgi:DNA polymerase-3 subunit gamma/tau
MELDDPFTDLSNSTVMQPSPMERTVAQEAPGGLGTLDEPSFMGRLRGVDPTVAVQVPAFNLDDPSMVGPLPTSQPSLPAVAARPAAPAQGQLITPPPLSRPNVPVPKPPVAAPPPQRPAQSSAGLRPEIASALPPSIAAAISAPRSTLDATTGPGRTNENSVPSFHLDDAVLSGDRSSPGAKFGSEASSPGMRVGAPVSGATGDEVSIPSFRIDTEEIFGSSVGTAATMIAKCRRPRAAPATTSRPAPCPSPEATSPRRSPRSPRPVMSQSRRARRAPSRRPRPTPHSTRRSTAPVPRRRAQAPCVAPSMRPIPRRCCST